MKKIIFCIALLSLGGLVFLCRHPILRFAGSLTMNEDAPQPVDAVMVLNGAFPRSLLAAADTYHSKLTNKIIITHEREWENMDALRNRRVPFPYFFDLEKKALLDLKVPKTDLVILPEVCDQTELEAAALQNYLNVHPEIQSVAFATRRSHTNRARKILRAMLKDRVRIRMIAFQGDPITPDTWYKDPWHLYEVTMEVLKLGWFYTVGLKHYPQAPAP